MEKMTMIEQNYLKWAGKEITKLKANLADSSAEIVNCHVEIELLRAERDALVQYARAKRLGDTEQALAAWIALDENTRREIEGDE